MGAGAPADAALVRHHDAALAAEEIALLAVVLRVLLDFGLVELDVVVERLDNALQLGFGKHHAVLLGVALELEAKCLGYDRLDVVERDIRIGLERVIDLVAELADGHGLVR